MKRNLIAYSWATGLIQFGFRIPNGAIGFATGDPSIVRKIVGGTARLSKVDSNLLVPGVPEAATPAAALDAMVAYATWLRQREQRGFHVLPRRTHPKRAEA